MTYKPGQLAVVTAANRREEYRAFFDGTTWRELACHAFCVDTPVTLRPLVVLDLNADGFGSPERAIAALIKCPTAGSVSHALAHEIAKQTRPAIEEPKGLGAVVEDSEGDRLTRYCDANDDGEWIGEDGRSWHWGDIDAVRVVWAGVTS